MSEYFLVLKRLQAERRALDGGDPPPAATSEAKARSVVRPRGEAAAEAAETAPTAFSQAYATLYDNLRAKANGHPTSALVFAGASRTAPVRSVIEGMAAHVRRLTTTVVVAELFESNGQPCLRVRPHVAGSPSTNTEPLALDLRSHAGCADVKRWLQDGVGPADLVIIESTALTDSIDSALLACACDGLVLVAEAEVTPRDALIVATERAQAVGCRPLGIVMYGTHRVPAWARRFLHQYRRPLSVQEER